LRPSAASVLPIHTLQGSVPAAAAGPLSRSNPLQRWFLAAGEVGADEGQSYRFKLFLFFLRVFIDRATASKKKSIPYQIVTGGSELL
jgi:hypothetical protein